MIDAKLIKDNLPDIKEENVQPLVELVNNTFKIKLEESETKGFGDGRKDALNKVDDALRANGYPRTSGLTSEHLSNVLVTLKESQLDENTKNKLTDYETENKKLQDQIKSGNPDFEQKELDYKNQIEVLQGTIEEKDTLFNEEKTKHKTDFVKMQLISNMPKTKEGISDRTKELHVNQTINDLIKIADLDDDGKVIFRDSEGKVMYNTANKNNPFTIEEMFNSNDNFKDILHEGRKQSGLGSNKGSKQTQTFSTSISGAATQVEADDIIRASLISGGLSPEDKEFHTKLTEIRKENNVDKLPLFL